MNTKQKKAKIAKLTKEMLKQSHDAMCRKVETVLNCGCLDLESWDETHTPMILPKSIVTAILQEESHQYNCHGTAFEKKLKREVKNIRNFL